MAYIGLVRLGSSRAQRPGLGGPQAARRDIGLIAEFARRFENAHARRRAGARLGVIVEHARDEARVDAGAFRNVTEL